MARINLVSTAAQNRVAGAHFEAVFAHCAATGGYLAIKQHLAYRFLKGGRAQALKSELDFSLITRDGRVAYVDLKSFNTHRVAKSMLSAQQIQRAVLYNTYSVCAGFVVQMRPLQKVYFFSGLTVHRLARGQSLGPGDGHLLGGATQFSLDAIFFA